MSINFISSKDTDETHNMHKKSNNIEIMMGSQTNDVIEEIFQFLFAKISRNIRIINEMK